MLLLPTNALQECRSTGPKVSICVPSLNTFPFLKERFETIFDQTFRNWELLVYDSHSSDGSWEYIQQLARTDDRMRIWQGPREGVYPAWNECIRRAQGEYVYIATSDDTMSQNCLEELTAALENHPECDLAHCPLLVIDEAGEILRDRSPWPNGTVFGHGLMHLTDEPHIRRAPYDGLLHLTEMHVYLSVTQLLIRKTLFSRIGFFQSTWGSVSDFNWEMKAGLVANVIHVPSTWASWRQHSKQLSAAINVRSYDRDLKFDQMIEDAVLTCEPYLDANIVAELKTHWLSSSRTMREYYSGLRRRQSSVRRKIFQLNQLFCGEKQIRSEIIHRVFGRAKWEQRLPAEIRLWLKSQAFDPITKISAKL